MTDPGQKPNDKFRHWIIALGFLMIFQLGVAIFCYQTLQGNTDEPTLSDSPTHWVEKLRGSDAGSYLEVGLRFADASRVESPCGTCSPPGWAPFTFWGPGTPVFIGTIFKVVSSQDMKGFFGVICVIDFLMNAVLLFGLAQILPNLKFLLAGAALVAVCPPLNLVFARYGSLTSSEVPTFALFGAIFCLMILSFKELWGEKSSRRIWKVAALFAALGLFIGLASLVRDSNSHFSLFLVLVMLVQRLLGRRAAWQRVLVATLLLFLVPQLVRLPVKMWNRSRIGVPLVSTSGSEAVWHSGLWGDYSAKNVSDANLRRWLDRIGIGVGAVIDPEAAAKVRLAYQENRNGRWVSIKELIKLLFRHPIEFLKFKGSRLPVLFLGAETVLPQLKLKGYGYYAAFLYLSLFCYLSLCVWRRSWPLEAFYAYPAFILASAALIHFEFRYTYPGLLAIKALPVFLAFEIKSILSRPSNGKKEVPI